MNEFQEFLAACGESPRGKGIPFYDYCILRDLFLRSKKPASKIQRLGALYEFENEVLPENLRIRIEKNGNKKIKRRTTSKKPCVVTLSDGTCKEFDSINKAVKSFPVASASNVIYHVSSSGKYSKNGVNFEIKMEG